MVFFSASAGADAEPSSDDVTYAEIKLKPLKKPKRIKGLTK